MSWIKTIPPEQASGKLSKLYTRVADANGRVDNILTAHSLRLHTLEGHMMLYKNVLHHSGNEIPVWFLECLGVYTSRINNCHYCVAHHEVGVEKQLDDPARAVALLHALSSDDLSPTFDDKSKAALNYARKLTVNPAEVSEADVVALRDAGWSDGQILEINQVVSYFAYANRTVLGLGVSTAGDILGTSPSDSSDPTNWSHR